MTGGPLTPGDDPADHLDAGEVDALPVIDEHSRSIDAAVDDVWTALGRVLARSTSRPGVAVGVRLLGARPSRGAGDPLRAGSTVPGFEVVRAERPVELVLLGRHRFSRYALTIRLEPGAGATAVHAETRAVFPGPLGLLYRTAVIGSRGHVVAVRRLLAAIAKSAAPGR